MCSCMWFGREPHSWLRQRFLLASRRWLFAKNGFVTGRQSQLTRAAISIHFGGISMVSNSMDGTPFEDTGMKVREMHWMQRVSSRLESSPSAWFKIKPRSMHPSVVWCNVSRAEPRTAKIPLLAINITVGQCAYMYKLILWRAKPVWWSWMALQGHTCPLPSHAAARCLSGRPEATISILRQDPPWFEFLVIFDFFAPWYRRRRDAFSVKIS